eukprot:scaffold15242_cov138-Isochrysis_galbana.AAC.6
MDRQQTVLAGSRGLTRRHRMSVRSGSCDFEAVSCQCQYQSVQCLVPMCVVPSCPQLPVASCQLPIR